MKNYLAFLLLFTFSIAFAQNTLKFNATNELVKATISDVGFITGYWVGEAFGGETEEIWSSPLGDSMMGSFKLVSNNKVDFYELCTISEDNETLFFRLKHFTADLKGWEEKDERINAQLVKIEENKVYFNNFTFERVNEKELNVYVLFTHNDGQEEEMKFNYKLKK